MKIALINHRLPYPLTSGTDKTRYNLLRTLSHEHEVVLFAPIEPGTPKSHIVEVERACSKLVPVKVNFRINQIASSRKLYVERMARMALNKIPAYVFENWYPALFQEIQAALENDHFDLVQALSDMTGYYLWNLKTAVPRLLGPVDDVIRQAEGDLRVARNKRKKLVWWLELRARRWYAPKMLRKCDAVVFSDRVDQQNMLRLSGDLPFSSILPLAVEPEDWVARSTSVPQDPNMIIFVGGMGAQFNQEGALFFSESILPFIWEKIPQAKFFIVGQDPPLMIQALHDGHRIFVTGKVHEIRPYLEQASVYVAPLRSGTGFKTKIVEALAAGKAIVSTQIGVSGLWDLGDDVIQIADNPQEFARDVVDLMQNTPVRSAQEQKSFELYKRVYSFEAVAPLTLAVYSEVFAAVKGATRQGQK